MSAERFFRGFFFSPFFFFRYLSLEAARAKRAVLDFNVIPKPLVPKHLGTTLMKDFPLAEVVPFIDWVPFFSVWQLKGKVRDG